MGQVVRFFNSRGYTIIVDLTIGNGNFGNTMCDGNGPTMEENHFNSNPSVMLNIVISVTVGEDTKDHS